MSETDPKLHLFKIARLRHGYNGRERLVEIGVCGINENSTGFIELHANNETWRLFPREKRKNEGE